MAIDPSLLEQALRTPETQDVTDTPIVRAMILPDAANAAELVPYLAQADSLAARNAQRILCQFGLAAVPVTLTALAASASAAARVEGLAAVWSMCIGEPAAAIRETLAASTAATNTLLDDRSPLPDDMPESVERDFRGRVCDLVFVVVRELLDPDYDQSTFRGMNPEERDRAIATLKSRGAGGLIA